jgi:hypothetical protein
MFGIAFARLAALALCTLGAGALVFPGPSSRGYGLPSNDPTAQAYVRATGLRDLVLGLILGALAGEDSRSGLTSAVAASTLVAAGDFALVSRSDTKEAKLATKVHGTGILGLLTLWAILRVGK